MGERLPLPAIPESPRFARHFVKERAVQWGYGAVVSEVELLTSEVVANAVLHAGGPIEVEVINLRDRLLVAVADPERHREPQRREAKPTDPSGRGLALVEALATDWGVAPVPDGGKIVWFTLAR